MKKKTPKENVILAMIAPIGVDLDRIEHLIIEQANEFGIKFDILDIVKTLKCFSKSRNDQNLKGFSRYSELMTIGDQERESGTHGCATLAKMISKYISADKNYIIHQLKSPEEVEYLRSKYFYDLTKIFFVISVFDTKENRLKRLEDKLKKSDKNSIKGQIKSAGSQAEELINRDEKDHEIKFGQNVREAFPLADFFIDASLRSEISPQVERILKAIFCYPHLSPTRDEYGMYLAEAVALKSRDLSRQVGAAILDEYGSILSVGCNEMPKAFGGSYWENDQPDNRDFVYGIDSSYKYRKEILEEFMMILSKIDNFSKESKKNFSTVIENDKNLLSFIEKINSKFKDTRLMNLIEFGRSMHAEIAALSEAARKGTSLQNSILYTTVFPCHLCARYIISVGIKKIIFIEPYPKSLTTDLYSSEVTLNNNPKKISMKPFIGIAPRIYRKIFIYHADKKNKDGKINPWKPNLTKWFHRIEHFKK